MNFKIIEVTDDSLSFFGIEHEVFLSAISDSVVKVIIPKSLEAQVGRIYNCKKVSLFNIDCKREAEDIGFLMDGHLVELSEENFFPQNAIIISFTGRILKGVKSSVKYVKHKAGLTPFIPFTISLKSRTGVLFTMLAVAHGKVVDDALAIPNNSIVKGTAVVRKQRHNDCLELKVTQISADDEYYEVN